MRWPNPTSAGRVLLVGATLVLVRVPFLLTQHVQEDAYITFRTARHLADHGDYSFNLGESVPGVTSHLYTALVALLRLLMGERFIWGALVLGTVLTVLAAYVFTLVFVAPKRRLWTFALLGASPPALSASYLGMETPLLLLALSLLAWSLARGRGRWLGTMSFLLPFVRPDAVAFGLLVFLASSLRGWRLAGVAAASTLAGGLALAGVNLAVSGDLLNQTILGKQAAYHPTHATGDVLSRAGTVFFTQSFLGPLHSKFVPGVVRVQWALALLALLVAFTGNALKEPRATGAAPAAFVALAVLLPPLAYAYGGVIFPWYLYPSAFLAYGAAIVFLTRSAKGRSWYLSASALMGTLAVGLLLLSFNIGVQEARYRRGVGLVIRIAASPGDTLFLEPAGYIPYFSDLRTFDDTALVSRDVYHALRRSPHRWRAKFLRDKRPTFIVERRQLIDTLEGASAEEIAWVASAYELVRHFRYDPSDFVHHSWLLPLLRLGTHSDYFLYQLRSAPPARGLAQPRDLSRPRGGTALPVAAGTQGLATALAKWTGRIAVHYRVPE